MALGTALAWDLLVRDNASPGFLRVAGAADKAAAATSRAQRSMGGIQAAAAKTGAVMTKALTVPLLGIAAVGIEQAAKWQKSMTLIQTAGGETAATTAALSKGLQQLAISTGTSLSNLGEGIYTVAKAGGQKWSANEQLLVMKAAAQGAKAEGVDLGTATNALTSIMMSYGASASDAVKFQDMLIVGAGRAKTTMQEYAASLSTVVPIASAAGINFAQVAGAIATLTQHGTSAAEATQELAFTIRNLQAPNNVAVAAMNQLGISSVNVSQNLGKRGLTGTLEFIESKLPKSGLVVLTAMKQMEAGSADLNTMLARMPTNLRNVSTEFLHGGLSAKDYRKDIRDLGAQGYAEGSQFLSLAAKVKGYNDSLRNGTPAQKTMAAELKAIFGGANGLNTALQLGGHNLEYFKTATDDVAAAAKHAGTDVLGWDKTQGTLSVRIDKAKEALQVLAVEIGTALIPVVTKIVGWISQAVHWFESLSGTDKKVIAWSAGILAAMGPLLSIGSRLILLGRTVGVAAAFIGTSFAKMAGASEVGVARVALAMRGLTSVLAGAGIGYAFGSLTQHASNGAKAVSAFASTAAGAAIGFGLGGPVGAALGGLAGGLSSLATSWFGEGQAASKAATAAKAALEAQKQAADDLFQALQQVNGAYNDQYKAVIANKLSKAGTLTELNKAGLNPQIAVQAALGQSGAIAQLQKLHDYYQRLSASVVGYDPGTGDAVYGNKPGAKGYAQYKAIDDALKQLGILAPAAKKAELDFEAFQKAMGATIVPAQQLAGGVRNLRAELAGTGTALDQSAYGRRNTEVIKENIAAFGQFASQQLKHGKAIADVSAAYQNQIALLRQNLVQMHFAPAAIDAIIKQYEHIPRAADAASTKVSQLQATINAIKQNKVPHLDADSAAAKARIAALQAQIDRLTGKTVLLAVDTSAADAQIRALIGLINSVPGTVVGKPGQSTQHRAVGGYILGPGSATSDSIPAWLSNGEYVINARQTAKHRPLLEAINRGSKGFKSGGYASGGFHLGGVGYPDQSSYQSALSSLTQTAAAMLAAANNTQASAQDIHSAAADLVVASRSQKVSAQLQQTLAMQGGRVSALASQRDRVSAMLGSAPSAPTAYDRLGAAQSAYAQEQSSVTGSFGFDVTTAGQNSWGVSTAGGILAAIQKTAANARTFSTVLKALVKRGLARTLVMQLAQAGPQALGAAQALMDATPAQFAEINADIRDLNSTATGAGTSIADDYFKSGVDAATAIVKGLQSKQTLLNNAIRAIAAQMASEFEAGLGIKQSPGASPARSVTVNVHGVSDPNAAAIATARRLAMAAA